MTSCKYFLLFFLIVCQYSLIFCDFTLTILHTNDVHSRFVSFNKQTRPCGREDIEKKKCWGGAARRMTAVKKIRLEESNVILLDGGDQYQGTIWYTALKWEPIERYMNLMKYDAVALGNHEFDNGIEGLEPYLQNLNSPVINSNIRDHGSGIKNLFRPKLIKTIGGKKIGIIGYTTTDTPALSNTGKYLEFENEVESLKIVADELKSEGIEIIIAVGHAGIQVDREICKNVKGVDIVVGGHTNTFLYTGQHPSTEIPEGPYPEVYTSTGSNCLVVQDYAFGKYLGKLKVIFDENGIAQNWSGNPILIDTNFEPDPEMETLLKPYSNRLEHYTKTVVGTTAVAIDGMRKSCRLKECNLGNLLTDAIVFSYVEKTGRDILAGNSKISGKTNFTGWTRAAIGIWNSGGIRDYETSSWSNITLESLYNIMPFGNTIEMIRLKGQTLMEAFEHAVGEYRVEDAHGRFLQVSGIKVQYDLSKPKNNRVINIQVRCDQCEVPDYEPLDREKEYNVVTIGYLAGGGDGYTVIRDNILKNDATDNLDIDVVMDYVKRFQPITIGNEGRIMFVKNEESTKMVFKNGTVSITILPQCLFFILAVLIAFTWMK